MGLSLLIVEVNQLNQSRKEITRQILTLKLSAKFGEQTPANFPVPVLEIFCF